MELVIDRTTTAESFIFGGNARVGPPGPAYPPSDPTPVCLGLAGGLVTCALTERKDYYRASSLLGNTHEADFCTEKKNSLSLVTVKY